MKKIVCVLGLPRSGTSVVAGILRIIGVDFGEVNEDKFEMHPTGIQEDHNIMEFNSELQKDYGGNLFEPPIIPSLKDDHRILDMYIPQLKEMLTEKVKGKEIWGFKDPRAIFLFHLYESVIRNPYIIFTQRDKIGLSNATLRYFPTLDKEQFEKNHKRFKKEVKRLRKQYGTHSVFFKSLICNPIKEAERMAEFIGLEITDEQRKKVKEFLIKDPRERRTWYQKFQ